MLENVKYYIKIINIRKNPHLHRTGSNGKNSGFAKKSFRMLAIDCLSEDYPLNKAMAQPIKRHASIPDHLQVKFVLNTHRLRTAFVLFVKTASDHRQYEPVS
jgi:hypothetical protein